MASAAIEAARIAAERRIEKPAPTPVFEDTGSLIGSSASVVPSHMVNEADDDRDSVHPGDQTVLIVENDLAFARVLLEAAREQGFKGIVTSQGTAALTMVNEVRPAAILLDIFLPDIEGWRVLSRLKNDLSARHIPVHVISTEEARDRALDSGARRFIAKPIQSRKAVDEVLAEIRRYTSTEERKLLLVEPDPVRLTTIREYLSGLENVQVICATDGPRAAEILRSGELDCAIVNPETPELDLHGVMNEIRESKAAPPPVIAYGRQAAASIGAAAVSALGRIPGVHEVHSIERLLDEVVLALHLDASRVKDQHRKVLDDIYGSTKALSGRRVLIVDDDIRNIFALSSVLEDYGMDIKTADNGREAIAIAQKGALDVILMDIMMPEMDGLETMKEIRKIPGCKDLPIVAVTAKAEAGMNARGGAPGDDSASPLERSNVLIVDDRLDKRVVFRTILEELDQNIVTASSGEEALRWLLDNECAVILLDVNMPGMDGLETAELIRARRKSAHTPIIFITAFADEMHTARGYSLGAVDYILSPVVPNILRSKVKALVQLHRLNAELKRWRARSTSTRSSRAPPDWSCRSSPTTARSCWWATAKPSARNAAPASRDGSSTWARSTPRSRRRSSTCSGSRSPTAPTRCATGWCPRPRTATPPPPRRWARSTPSRWSRAARRAARCCSPSAPRDAASPARTCRSPTASRGAPRARSTTASSTRRSRRTTSARTNSSPRSRTSCAIRSRRCARRCTCCARNRSIRSARARSWRPWTARSRR